MEGRIAEWYARNTREHHRHRSSAAAFAQLLPPGARVLELAPGPGYFAIELARPAESRPTSISVTRAW